MQRSMVVLPSPMPDITLSPGTLGQQVYSVPLGEGEHLPTISCHLTYVVNHGKSSQSTKDMRQQPQSPTMSTTIHVILPLPLNRTDFSYDSHNQSN